VTTACLQGRRSRRRPLQAKAGANRDTVSSWFQGKVQEVKDRPKFDASLSQSGSVALKDALLPARGQEPWRYTDLDALLYAESAGSTISSSKEEIEEIASSMLEDHVEGAHRLVFMDGQLCPTLSNLSLSSQDLLVGGSGEMQTTFAAHRERILDLLEPIPELDMFVSSTKDSMGCSALAALNQASFVDCACVCSPAKDQPSDSCERVELFFITTGGGTECCCPRVLIDAGANTKLHVVESHLSLTPSDTSLSNGLCRVLVANGAEVKHELLQQKAERARFVESIFTEVGENADYTFRAVQTGSKAARLNTAVALLGEKSCCGLSATMIAYQEQQLDIHSIIHHQVPSCKSSQQQKNVVADSGECIFKGSIFVDKKAQQTESSQICRTLLLSKKAKVKAMPTLQIRADDVSCSHGAAVTELSQDELFYMSSRGLDVGTAKGLLLVAYPQDLIADLESIVPKAYKRIQDKLAAVAEHI